MPVVRERALPVMPRAGGRRPLLRALTGRAGGGVPQPNCQERLDRPYQKPSMTLVASGQVVGGSGGAERDEQRREVLGARVGEPGGRGVVQEVEQRVDVPGCERLARPRRRTPPTSAGAGASPVSPKSSQRRLWVVKPEPTISTPSSRSGASLRPISNSSRGSRRRHRDLQHRDVGLGEHLHQRHVGAVVQAAVRVLVDRRCRARGSSAAHVGGQLAARRARRTSPGSSARGSPRSRRPAAPASVAPTGERRLLPVRRDHEDALRARQVGRPGGELPRSRWGRRPAAGRRG